MGVSPDDDSRTVAHRKLVQKWFDARRDRAEEVPRFHDRLRASGLQDGMLFKVVDRPDDPNELMALERFSRL